MNFLGRWTIPLLHPLLSASTAPRPLTEILNTPLHTAEQVARLLQKNSEIKDRGKCLKVGVKLLSSISPHTFGCKAPPLRGGPLKRRES